MVVLKTISILCLVVAIRAAHSPELFLKLSNGSPVLGHYLTTHSGRGIRSFANIPYAEAPIGNLRFAEPVPKAPWTEVRPLNQQEVIMCPQREHFFFQGQYFGQEDCLYLNVHVPMVRSFFFKNQI